MPSDLQIFAILAGLASIPFTIGGVIGYLLGRRARPASASPASASPATALPARSAAPPVAARTPPPALAPARSGAPSVVPTTAAADVEALAAATSTGGRPLVVNHWATWCEPCVEELPYLARVAARHHARVRFLGVSWDRFTDARPEEQVCATVDEARRAAGASFPTVLAPPDPRAVFGRLALQWEVVPQTYVLAADGTRIWTHSGEIVEDADRAAFEAAIERAAGSAP